MSNLSAFLTAIATSEGTQNVPGGNDGYNVLVGGGLFAGYADHPRITVNLGHGLFSTAAGRYQILARWFDAYKKSLNLPDFSPASQDAIAVQMLKEVGALADIQDGNFQVAISKASSHWASLPGSPFGQHTNSLADVQQAYTAAGGTVA